MANWSSGGWRQVAERGGEQDSVDDGRDGHDAERQPLYEIRPQAAFGDGLRVGAGDGFEDCLSLLGVNSCGREPLDDRVRVESDVLGRIPPVEGWGVRQGEAGRRKAEDVVGEPGAQQLADLLAYSVDRAFKSEDLDYLDFERVPGSFYGRRRGTALDGLEGLARPLVAVRAGD